MNPPRAMLWLAPILSFSCSSENGSTDGNQPAAVAGASAMGGAPSASQGGGTASVAGGGTAGSGGSVSTGKWSMGYYASWQASAYPISEIEWSGLSHVAMAFYLPSATGSLTLAGGGPTLERELVTEAHAHGVKAIASLGGADSASAFRLATASGTIASFVTNLVALTTASGYDGLDVDWEPLTKADEPIAIDLANRIRAAAPSVLLTIPIGIINVNLGADLSNYAGIAAAYDQLNIMSYGMSGAWEGWKSWHSSPLYHQDSATPTSIDSTVARYVAAGVPKQKLGIGIGFYGLCYGTPVTGPDQALAGATLLAGDGAISYANIMSRYYSAPERQWDALARVPYLSFASPKAPDGCSYISYDDEQSIAEKAAYVKVNALGGVIQWEINEGYLPSAPAGQRNPLLSAIAQELLR